MLFFSSLSLFLILIWLIFSIGAEYIKIHNKLCTPFVQLGSDSVSESEAKRLCTQDIHCTMMYKDGGNQKFNKCTINSTMTTSDMRSIVYSKERFICPDTYFDILDKSDFCFRRTNGKDTWEGAKKKCMNEKGDLACLRNIEESKKLLKFCNNCWIGYKWRDKNYWKLEFGAWKLATSLTNTGCKDQFKIEIGSTNWLDTGKCSRLESKLISDVPVIGIENIPFTGGECADSIETHHYICQKPKIDLCSQQTCENGGNELLDNDPSSSTRLFTTTSEIFVPSLSAFSLKIIIAISCSGVVVLGGILVLFIRYMKTQSAQKATGSKSQQEMVLVNFKFGEILIDLKNDKLRYMLES